MSSNPIPKERQSAYQRWEMASFGDERPAARAASAAQLAEQLAARREEARQQGYEAGLAEGRAAGLEQGRAQAERERAQLLELASSLQAEIEQAKETIAADMLQLAFDIAKAMLKTALPARPELVLPLVGEVIHYLPALQQPALLFLHPADAALVREQMGEQLSNAGWRLTEDAHLERGGCRVETASNQIDASPAMRWQRIAEALGKNDDWLAA